jgi:hypothetical protein
VGCSKIPLERGNINFHLPRASVLRLRAPRSFSISWIGDAASPVEGRSSHSFHRFRANVLVENYPMLHLLETECNINTHSAEAGVIMLTFTPQNVSVGAEIPDKAQV